MAYSSILGGEPAPSRPDGRGSDLLGPSDNSDSGSDAIGTAEAHADSDAVGTGERGGVDGIDAIEGADIAPDRVVSLEELQAAEELGEAVTSGPGVGNGFPEADPDGREYTDLDSDTDDDVADRGADSDGERKR